MTEFREPVSVLVFHLKPKSVPGDLRISWRLSVTLLALRYCWGKRASFVKLHILNDVLRSEAMRRRLVAALNNNPTTGVFPIRVEPAFGRNLDLLTGKGLAKWRVASNRLSIQLTPRGIDIANMIDAEEDLFVDERQFLSTVGRDITEHFVRSLVASRT